MDSSTIARQLLLYGHLLAFAFAFAAIVREDLALARASRLDRPRLRRTARLVLALLGVLWVTGLAMLAIEGRLAPSQWLDQPKLAAKITVVALLTLNGLLLHHVAFPLLTGERHCPRRAAFVAVTLGVVSGVGWSYAAFLGVARVIAPAMSYRAFLALFGVVLALALVVGLVWVRPALARLLGRERRLPGAVEAALRQSCGTASSLILDPATRRAHADDPVAYARALAARIPDRAAVARAAFLREVEPVLGPLASPGRNDAGRGPGSPSRLA